MDSKKFLDEISGKSINFLIGSGASAGSIPTLWINSISKSFEEILVESTGDEKKVLHYFWFIYWIRKTKVDISEKINQDIIKNYTKFINSLVRIANNEGYDKHKRINIFTTNYDTFFEHSFDKSSESNRLSYFNDGSRGFINKYISTDDFYINVNYSGVSDGFQRTIPTINLIKLHGSVTWVKNNSRIKVSMQNELFDSLITLSEKINKKLIETEEFELLSINNFDRYLNSKEFSEESFKSTLGLLVEKFSIDFEKFYSEFIKLPVVNPTNKKFKETVFEQHYYQMLRLFSFELEKQDSVLIVFGFSFADEHILEIVRRSIVNPSLKIYIISYDKEAQERVKKLLGQEYRIDYIPNFDNIKKGSSINGDFEYFNALFEGTKE